MLDLHTRDYGYVEVSPPLLVNRDTLTGTGPEDLTVGGTVNLRSLKVGATDYVVKPFSDEILAARLRSAVRVKSSHDTIARMNRQLRAEIAERERAEAEATVAKQRIEFILGATKTGLAIVDSRYRLVYVDPQWRKHYGADTHGSRKVRCPCRTCCLSTVAKDSLPRR